MKLADDWLHLQKQAVQPGGGALETLRSELFHSFGFYTRMQLWVVKEKVVNVFSPVFAAAC